MACIDPHYGPAALKVAYSIGAAIAKMHDADIVHGDLTTSNLMLSSAEATEVVRLGCFRSPTMVLLVCMFSRSRRFYCSLKTVIDFGLANSQPLPEDKAVDLYVMERAFNSTHINSEILVRPHVSGFGSNHFC